MICTELMISIPLEDEDDHLATRTAESDSSTDVHVEPSEYLNGEFDARTIHLYDLHDDPSSSEEEQSDNENMYVCCIKSTLQYCAIK